MIKPKNFVIRHRHDVMQEFTHHFGNSLRIVCVCTSDVKHHMVSRCKATAHVWPRQRGNLAAQFELVLCSQFLFLYSDHFSYEFHRAVFIEML